MALPNKSNEKELKAMANKSKEWYVEHNDFEGAFDRWETTSPRWKKSWYEVCEKIFNASRRWAENYVLNPINQTIHRIKDIRNAFAPKVRTNGIAISNDCPNWNNEKGIQKCYLIEFFNRNKESICSKVGTTIRSVQQRIKEELDSDTYQKMGATSCVIHRVYDCGEIPAEGLESRFRAEYIRKYPKSFSKNDRFINTQFDLVEADRICAEYLMA